MLLKQKQLNKTNNKIKILAKIIITMRREMNGKFYRCLLIRLGCTSCLPKSCLCELIFPEALKMLRPITSLSV